MEKKTIKLELRFQGKLKFIEHEGRELVVGRSDKLKASLSGCPALSREHVKFEVRENELWFTDLGSTNGTWYAGKRIQPKTPVKYDGKGLWLGTGDTGVQIIPTLHIESLELSKPHVPGLFIAPVEIETQKDPTSSYRAPDTRSGALTSSPEHSSSAILNPNSRSSSLNPLAGLPLDPPLKKPMDLTPEANNEYSMVRDFSSVSLSALRATPPSTPAEAPVPVAKAEPAIEAIQSTPVVQATPPVQTAPSVPEMQAAPSEPATPKVQAVEQQPISSAPVAASLEQPASQLPVHYEISAPSAPATPVPSYDAEIAQALSEEILKLGLEKLEFQNRIETLKQELESLERRQSFAESVIAQADAKQKEFEQFSMQVRTSQAALATVRDETAALVNELGLLNTSKREVQSEIESHQQQYLAVKESLLQEQTRYERAKFEHSQEEDRIRAEVEQKKQQMQLQSDAQEAQYKLRSAQIEREIEELKTRQITLSREHQDLMEKTLRSRSEVEDLQKQVAALEKQISDGKSRVENLTRETTALEGSKQALEQQTASLSSQIEAAHLEAKRIIEAGRADMQKAKETAESEITQFKSEAFAEVQKLKKECEDSCTALRTQTQSEIDSWKVSAQKEIADAKHESEEMISKSRAAWTSEYEVIKAKALHDHEAATRSWQSEMASRREKDSEELRLWKAGEEKRVRELLAQSHEGLAHQLAMSTLSDFKPDQSVPVSSLLTTLESRLKTVIQGKALEFTAHNPDRKKNTQKFWGKVAAAAVAAVVLYFGIAHGPKLMGRQIAEMKAANKEENAAFMIEVRQQRERMLALHLEAKTEFQENYTDNVLYNPGYLAMKLDEKIRKEWTVILSQFFFKELLYDDRRVVEFIPVESSLIDGLNETYKVLNSQNFAMNVAKMRDHEKSKLETMWTVVGGHDNWVKIREREKHFYLNSLGLDDASARVPAEQK